MILALGMHVPLNKSEMTAKLIPSFDPGDPSDDGRINQITRHFRQGYCYSPGCLRSNALPSGQEGSHDTEPWDNRLSGDIQFLFKLTTQLETGPRTLARQVVALPSN